MLFANRTIKASVAGVLAIWTWMLPVQHAAAEEKRDEYSIKEDELGSHIKRKRVTSTLLPINKRYDELTDEQKAVVRSNYDHLPDTDEPPFPRDGLQSIFKYVHKLEQKLLARGVFSADVMIDSQGEPVEVTIHDRTDDEQMNNAIAFVLMKAQYKPGKCKGEPCKMAYRFDFEFSVTVR